MSEYSHAAHLAEEVERERLTEAQIRRQMAGEELERRRMETGEMPTIVVENQISLRDWFAGHCLAGNLANPDYHWPKYPTDLSADCYKVADAMMKARETKGENDENSSTDG